MTLPCIIEKPDIWPTLSDPVVIQGLSLPMSFDLMCSSKAILKLFKITLSATSQLPFCIDGEFGVI